MLICTKSGYITLQRNRARNVKWGKVTEKICSGRKVVRELQQIPGKELFEEKVNTFRHIRVASARSFLQMIWEYVTRTQNDIRISKEKPHSKLVKKKKQTKTLLLMSANEIISRESQIFYAKQSEKILEKRQPCSVVVFSSWNCIVDINVYFRRTSKENIFVMVSEDADASKKYHQWMIKIEYDQTFSLTVMFWYIISWWLQRHLSWSKDI